MEKHAIALSKCQILGASCIIFVTIGTSSWQFDRLIKEMDRIAKTIDEEVLMQIANTNYEPSHAHYFRFASNECVDNAYKSCRLIVAHAGAGCVLSASRYSKPLILVPRRSEFSEHFDNHQIDMSKELEKDGDVTIIWDISNLERAIEASSLMKPFGKRNCSMIDPLRDYINKYCQVE